MQCGIALSHHSSLRLIQHCGQSKYKHCFSIIITEVTLFCHWLKGTAQEYVRHFTLTDGTAVNNAVHPCGSFLDAKLLLNKWA